jgi:hypothetical protein
MNNTLPTFRVIKTSINSLYVTDNLNELICYLLQSDEEDTILIIKSDHRGHRIIKLDGCAMSFDALEMVLTESIM